MPSDGAYIGNKALREKLSWNKDKYFAVRNRLVDWNIVEKGKGNGGSSRLVGEFEIPDHKKNEQELYVPACDVIRDSWAKEEYYAGKDDSYFVEITANQGRRQTGGKWTRPDITLIGYKKYKYVPGTFLSVISFEVKIAESVNVDAVYEALGHARYVTHAYVLLYAPYREDPDAKARIANILNEAKRHNVGVIVAEKIDEFDTWETLLEATRQEPDPANLNEFIGIQLKNVRDQIAIWVGNS